MFDNVKKLFAAKPDEPKAPKGEVAWSESSMYRAADFPKYNPDELIGRKGYAVYSKMMTDEQVKAVVHFKRDAVTSRDYFFEISGDALSEDEKQDRIELSNEIIKRMEAPFSDALNGIMSAMYNGFSMTEKVTKIFEYDGKNWVGIKKLKLKPCDTFYFHVDDYGNIEKVSQKFDMREQQIDADRFIHFVQNPDKDEHYGQSELREAYRPWFCKDMALKFQNIHLERFAAGFVWASPTNGKSLVSGTAEMLSLQAAMTNLQATSSIIMPANIDLHIEHPATTDAFERAVAQHDKSIAKALLVPNLLGITEQGSTGSYSQSQTQLEAFLWTLEADATRLEAVLNAQLFNELGELNWGDGNYPRFKFKPISDAQQIEVVKLWKELVTAGAVQSTEADETHIRESLEMPKKPAVEEGVPELVLSAEQVSVLLDIVAKVSAGSLAPELAKILLGTLFRMPEEEASLLIDAAVVEKEPVPAAIDPNANPDDQQDPNADPAAKADPNAEPAEEVDPAAAQAHEETIVGKMGISVSAFSRAMKRVDFAVIDNKAENSVEDYSYQIAALNGQVVARLVAQAEELKLGTAEGNPDDLRSIAYTAAEVSKLKSLINASLQDAWRIGESHGKKELAKAKFATNDLALQEIADKYLKSKSYTLAGDISGATQKKIQGILAEGIKVSKSAADTRREIYKALEAEGLIDEESIMDALGTTTVKDTKARINTAIRTTSFEAINEARYNLFSDPQLAGFVEALEYSAILDDRTTEICSQLDGQTYSIDDEVWSTFRPPNHFNCRSVLIAVLQGDTWQQGEAPTVGPQKGFGFTRTCTHTHERTVTVRTK